MHTCYVTMCMSCKVMTALAPEDFGSSRCWQFSLGFVSQHQATLTEERSPWAIHLHFFTLLRVLTVKSAQRYPFTLTFLMSSACRWDFCSLQCRPQITMTLWVVWRPVNFLTRRWEVLVTCVSPNLTSFITSPRLAGSSYGLRSQLKL